MDRINARSRLAKFDSRAVMQIAVSLCLLIAALFVVLSRGNYGPNVEHWAFATVGTILGFWLKAGR